MKDTMTATTNTPTTSDGTVVQFPATPVASKSITINRHHLSRKARLLPCNKKENTDFETVTERASDPIKNLEDIDRICNYFLEREQYRDYMLFVVGINFGLRYADLLRLRFCHILNEDMSFKESFDIVESKTAETRKKKKNRHVVINESVMDAIEIYLTHTDNVHLDDHMFPSHSNNGKYEDRSIDRKSVYRIFQKAKKDLNLDFRFGVHTLRKTFAYHQMAMSNHDPRKLTLLQKMYGHSSINDTLRYIGLTNEEMEEAYLGLNLGGNDYSKAPVKEAIIVS